MTLLTAEIAREFLEYRDGQLFWIKKPARCINVGERAGSICKYGTRRKVRLFDKHYQEHRLIWLIVKGEWPKSELDHKDCDKLNSKIENLREATRSQNCANRRRFTKSMSGLKGVSWCKQTGKWRAAIKVNNKLIHLGRYVSSETAHREYVVAAEKFFGEFARAE